MAELTFKSAGVSTREIDLSQPTTSGPRGVPAGVIGTSNDGPAFVPVTVASYREFASIFGKTDGEKFGPLAASEYLKNAEALTYVRVLGIGDGKKRDTTTGVVTNAGFTVGEKLVQANGTVSDNIFSNSAIGGRTYFLGCFLSESAGSTILSSAGIQNADRGSTCTITLGLNTADTTLLADGDEVLIKDVFGQDHIFEFKNNGATSSSPRITVAMSSGNVSARTGVQIATDLAAIINSSDTPLSATALLNVVTVTQATPGIFGNTIDAPAGTAASQNNITGSTFTLGAGGAVPVVRGVLFAANGVILDLHTGSNSLASAPHPAGEAADFQISGGSRYLNLTGSVSLSSQQFVMSLRGIKGTSEVKTTVTASFDVQSSNYFANVFNKDPLKLESEGHLLYSHYDLHPNMVVLTGSQAILGAHKSAGETVNSTTEDLAFLLTGSNSRGLASNLGNVPDYEDFQDRFTHAESTYVISQNNKNLFKLVALSPGENISNKIKFSIESLKPGNLSKNQHGSFDLIIRSLEDTDDNKIPLETYRNINLDPGSDRYIGRVIGDNNVFFDFDSNPETQKILVEGSHPNRSKYVRVVLGSDVTNKNVEVTDIPVGYRGAKHLVTSGTLLTSVPDERVYSSTDILKRAIEPPIPFREKLSIGTGLNEKVDNRFYWGIQTTRKIDPSNPNKNAAFDKSFFSFAKHFPTHRKDTIAFSVGENEGTVDINGSVLDSDRFNNNKFSLLNIKVRTGSDGLADPSKWISASYSRNGSGLTDNPANKTRGLKFSETHNDLDRVGNRKYIKFTGFFQGGFDGSNIFNGDKQKFLNNAAKREIDDTTNQGGTAGPTVSAYRKAIDIMESKSDVDIQLLAIPGARHSSITDYAISAVENRFDAVYLMDIEERDQVDQVVTSSVNQITSVTNTVKSFKNRALDSSFTAAYFPDVNIVDPTTNAIVQAPPSVSVLGAYSLNDKLGHPWFAPAGFARGALNAVDNTSVLLNRENLDDLYDADINPIASFPGAGVTIWGQKTLLQNQSALDRVNVRRLLIDIRRKVRNIANSLLFEPNREETLEKFSGLVNPILQRVQSLSGVDRYKVVIDTSTTTQADVENNTIRGKIFLQPTRTVEFVALDFVVTNAGSNLL